MLLASALQRGYQKRGPLSGWSGSSLGMKRPSRASGTREKRIASRNPLHTPHRTNFKRQVAQSPEKHIAAPPIWRFPDRNRHTPQTLKGLSINKVVNLRSMFVAAR